jgi:hypothetical protein
MGATAGDLLARDVVCGWLAAESVAYDVAITPQLGDGVDWAAVEPRAYSHVVFVCGPLGNGEPATTLFDRFAHADLIGVDLSMLHAVDEWNPFALLLERDSDRGGRPDIALLAGAPLVPLVGVVLVHDQKEYPGGRHKEVHAAINEALTGLDVARLDIDTCLDPPNSTGLHTAAQVESAIAAVDVVVTTRLHGLVLAMKHGVPVLAVDPVAGGAKVSRQATALGWPHVFVPEEVTVERLRARLFECLAPESRQLVAQCAAEARARLGDAHREFADYISAAAARG